MHFILCICIDRSINPLSSAIASFYTCHATQLRTFQIFLLCWRCPLYGCNHQKKVWTRLEDPRLFSTMVHQYLLLHLTALILPEIPSLSPLATCSLGSHCLLPDAPPGSKSRSLFISHTRSCSGTQNVWAFGFHSWGQKLWPAKMCAVIEIVLWLRPNLQQAEWKMGTLI